MSVQSEQVPRAAHIGVRLAWVAMGLSCAVVVVSGVLAIQIGELFTAAVVEGWAVPFTGEAEEQRILPGSVTCGCSILVLLTSLLAWELHRCVKERYRGNGLLASFGAVVGVLGALLMSLWVLTLANGQYTWRLYGWWYAPFFIVMVMVYAGCLAGAAIALTRPSVRRWAIHPYRL